MNLNKGIFFCQSRRPYEQENQYDFHTLTMIDYNKNKNKNNNFVLPIKGPQGANNLIQ